MKGTLLTFTIHCYSVYQRQIDIGERPKKSTVKVFWQGPSFVSDQGMSSFGNIKMKSETSSRHKICTTKISKISFSKVVALGFGFDDTFFPHLSGEGC